MTSNPVHPSKRVELVFRSIGERTAPIALKLAVAAIQPQRVHLIENVRPFTSTVRRCLRLKHECDFVVYVDADCLIFQDMRPFLEFNEFPFVDCVVRDRFRGRQSCGVHVLRTDLVSAMARVSPPKDDLNYVLRPESHIRNLAMRKLRMPKQVKQFEILHDHLQNYADVFCKIALRELRSRRPSSLNRLERRMASWGEDPEFRVARLAILHAREQVQPQTTQQEIAGFLTRLPDIARKTIASLNLPEQRTNIAPEVDTLQSRYMVASIPVSKVFGIGLSGTGTRSLNAALTTLGHESIHYPVDSITLNEIKSGGKLSLLEHYNGLTDITTAPIFERLDHLYPGSKFILTLREKENWLKMMRDRWSGKSDATLRDRDGGETRLEVRRYLRKAVYNTIEFDTGALADAYDRHHLAVREYFRGREADLLEFNILDGSAQWPTLCSFLDKPVPDEKFPHSGRRKPRLSGLRKRYERIRKSFKRVLKI